MAVTSVSSIGVSWEPCRIDDVKCILNPLQQCDLIEILHRTIPLRRVKITMVFCGIEDNLELIVLSGLAPSKESIRNKTIGHEMTVNFSRWLNKEHRLPMGMAFRIARVFGVSPELLFEGFI